MTTPPKQRPDEPRAAARLPAPTALRVTLALTLCLALFHASEVLREPTPWLGLPAAATRLLFPTRPIDLLLLAVLAVLVVRHARARRAAIRANPALLRLPVDTPPLRRWLSLGWPAVWRVQALSTLIVFVAIGARAPMATLAFGAFGFAAMTPVAAWLLQRRARQACGGSTRGLMPTLLWRCLVVLFAAHQLRLLADVVATSLRHEPMRVFEWAIVLAALGALQALALGWATGTALASSDRG